MTDRIDDLIQRLNGAKYVSDADCLVELSDAEHIIRQWAGEQPEGMLSTHLGLLRVAIISGDPKKELLRRVADMEALPENNATLQPVAGEQQARDDQLQALNDMVVNQAETIGKLRSQIDVHMDTIRHQEQQIGELDTPQPVAGELRENVIQDIVNFCDATCSTAAIDECEELADRILALLSSAPREPSYDMLQSLLQNTAQALGLNGPWNKAEKWDSWHDIPAKVVALKSPPPREPSDGLRELLKDAMQLLHQVGMWKHQDIDDQWRMSYKEVAERYALLAATPRDESKEGGR